MLAQALSSYDGHGHECRVQKSCFLVLLMKHLPKQELKIFIEVVEAMQWQLQARILTSLGLVHG
jgi:hypothetical protein